jgi:hypothetical protein
MMMDNVKRRSPNVSVRTLATSIITSSFLLKSFNIEPGVEFVTTGING